MVGSRSQRVGARPPRLLDEMLSSIMYSYVLYQNRTQNNIEVCVLKSLTKGTYLFSLKQTA